MIIVEDEKTKNILISITSLLLKTITKAKLDNMTFEDVQTVIKDITEFAPVLNNTVIMSPLMKKLIDRENKNKANNKKKQNGSDTKDKLKVIK